MLRTIHLLLPLAGAVGLSLSVAGCASCDSAPSSPDDGGTRADDDAGDGANDKDAGEPALDGGDGADGGGAGADGGGGEEPDAGQEPPGDGGLPPTACSAGSCPSEQVCDVETGLCRAPTCYDTPCPGTQLCDPSTNECREAPVLAGEPRYSYEDIVNYTDRGNLDGPGLEAHAGGPGTTPTTDGRFLYWWEGRSGRQSIMRWDATSGVVTRIAGGGMRGYVDGPFLSARFDVNQYGGGGTALSFDGERFYLLDQQDLGGAIRVIDFASGDVSTLAAGQIGAKTGGAHVRALAMGHISGDLYVGGFGGLFRVTQAGAVTEIPVDDAGLINFMAVDEARGRIYVVNRNRLGTNDPGSPLFAWDITGGAKVVLNDIGRQSTNPSVDQYVTDGPVSGMTMFGPLDIVLGADGFAYIGGGDSRTFRRYDPDNQWVTSLCYDDADETYFWCVGDGQNNKDHLFRTWCNRLAFDGAGNGYFYFSVFDKMGKLRRLP